MSKPGFTPGPWFVRAYEAAFWVVSGDGMKIVNTSWHDAIRNPYPLKPEARANVDLIAAAPALYEALQRVVDAYGFDPSIDSSIWNEAGAALSLALGEKQGG